MNYNKKIDIYSYFGTRPKLHIILIPLILCAMILSLIIWMTFSEIDIVSSTRGKIITSLGIQLIQSKTVDKVEKLYVEEGEEVKEGDILISFKKEDILMEKEQILNSIGVVKGEIFRFLKIKEFLTKEKSPITEKTEDIPAEILARQKYLLNNQIDLFQKEMTNMEAKIESKVEQKRLTQTEIDKIKSLIPYIEKKIERLSPLVIQGLASQDELDTHTERLAEKTEDIKIREAELSRISAEITISETEKEKNKADFKEQTAQQLSKAQTKLDALNIELAKIEDMLKAKTLYAPIDGVIHNLRVYTVGGVVQSGEIIMEVIPKDALLEVEAKVLNKDIGFISIGQEAKFKIDSFPFTKYGYIEGTVKKIEHAAVVDEKMGNVYPATIELKQNFIKADKKKVNLIPGMTGTADITIGKRTIIEYVLAPFLRYRYEAMKEK